MSENPLRGFEENTSSKIFTGDGKHPFHFLLVGVLASIEIICLLLLGGGVILEFSNPQAKFSGIFAAFALLLSLPLLLFLVFQFVWYRTRTQATFILATLVPVVITIAGIFRILLVFTA